MRSEAGAIENSGFLEAGEDRNREGQFIES